MPGFLDSYDYGHDVIILASCFVRLSWDSAFAKAYSSPPPSTRFFSRITLQPYGWKGLLYIVQKISRDDHHMLYKPIHKVTFVVTVTHYDLTYHHRRRI
ncbi:MAG: hypothetical protein WBA16_07265 [Nonlabens sp.]